VRFATICQSTPFFLLVDTHTVLCVYKWLYDVRLVHRSNASLETHRKMVLLLSAQQTYPTSSFVTSFRTMKTSSFTNRFSRMFARQRSFFFCPTLDCQLAYRTGVEGLNLKCFKCLSEICCYCHTRAHVGIACKENGI